MNPRGPHCLRLTSRVSLRGADGGKWDAEKCVPRLWTEVQVLEGRRMTSGEKSSLSGMWAEIRFILLPAFPGTPQKSPLPFPLPLLSARFWSVFFAPLPLPRCGHASRYISSPLLSLHTSFISSLLNARPRLSLPLHLLSLL